LDDDEITGEQEGEASEDMQGWIAFIDNRG